ncbi:hypothetical protein [Faecalispora sporosphaeroides]|nr:hypothetical protein [Faecalispora sporosphaeroides]
MNGNLELPGKKISIATECCFIIDPHAAGESKAFGGRKSIEAPSDGIGG